jgi:hypothetical protein
VLFESFTDEALIDLLHAHRSVQEIISLFMLWKEPYLVKDRVLDLILAGKVDVQKLYIPL